MAVVVNFPKPGTVDEPVTVVEGSGDLPNPGDRSLEDVNNFNKREDVPVTEQKGIEFPEGSLVSGPLADPSSGNYPDPYWKRLPPGSPDHKPVQFIERGWLPDEIIPMEPYQEDEE